MVYENWSFRFHYFDLVTSFVFILLYFIVFYMIPRARYVQKSFISCFTSFCCSGRLLYIWLYFILNYFLFIKLIFFIIIIFLFWKSWNKNLFLYIHSPTYSNIPTYTRFVMVESLLLELWFKVVFFLLVYCISTSI